MVHSFSTVGAQCRPVVHMAWGAVPVGAPLWCRAMSQTPTYDQLRDERINADIPASEAVPHEVSYSGKHRLVADPSLAAVCGSPPGAGVDHVGCWSWFETGEQGGANPATATRPVHCSAGTPGAGHAPAANQQADTDQREISAQAPQPVLLPPPAHTRDRRQPGRSAPAATRKPTP